jgi:ABC-type transport system involved in multi-copper enzyme maturation permease subunit
MNNSMLIGLNTFRETIRDKILYNILVLGIAFIFLTISFGEWSVFARIQVMSEFGLATLSIVGLLLAVFIGAGMLGREIHNKTMYTLLAKPVERYQVVVGKFLGLLATLTLNYAILSLVLFTTLKLLGGGSVQLLIAVVMLLIELAVITAAALFFSTITNTTIAAMMTLVFYIAGHYNDLLEIGMVSRHSPLYGLLLRTIYYLVPNLEHFNVRDAVVYGAGIDMAVAGYSALYGICYTVVLLCAAALIFTRKDM